MREGCKSVNPPAGQVVDYLRLSVTDRCNYRCVYCMPPEGVPFKPHEEMLSYEDMVFFVRAAVRDGHLQGAAHRGRAAGAQGPARPGRADPGYARIRDISLTTNGVLLPRFAEALKAQGLDRVNISLDSLDPSATGG